MIRSLRGTFIFRFCFENLRHLPAIKKRGNPLNGIGQRYHYKAHQIQFNRRPEIHTLDFLNMIHD